MRFTANICFVVRNCTATTSECAPRPSACFTSNCSLFAFAALFAEPIVESFFEKLFLFFAFLCFHFLAFSHCN